MIGLLLVLGCGGVPGDSPGAPEPQVADGMPGYSWVEPGVLAAMPYPGSADLMWIADDGVELLVTLTEAPLPPDSLEAAGLDTLHLPIPDFRAPTDEQVDLYVATMEERVAREEAVGVHCLAGRGRSGTMAAIWLVHEGLDAAAAIDAVRQLRPGSIETTEQEQAVFDYAARLP